MDDSKKILIVGSRRDTVQILKSYLRGRYEVQIADYSTKVMLEYENNTPDLVLVYLETDDIDNIGAFAGVMENSAYAKIPIVLIASVADFQSIRHVLPVEEEDVLRRPADRSSVMGRIMRYFQDESDIGRPKVLAIDDDDVSLKILNTYLQDEYSVVTANSCKEAIKYLSNNIVDIIILDVEMPDIDGYATFDSIRKIPTCGETPVIFSSGHMEKHTIMKCITLGCADYILKPVNKADAVRKIEDALNEVLMKKERKNILVIDDDKEYLKIMKTYLEEVYYVNIVNSGRMAMEFLAKHSPDLILLDYQMPLHNGPAVYNMIKSRQESQNIPIIFMTGFADREIVMECMSYKPTGYMVKPIVKGELLSRLDQIFE